MYNSVTYRNYLFSLLEQTFREFIGYCSGSKAKGSCQPNRSEGDGQLVSGFFLADYLDVFIKFIYIFMH